MERITQLIADLTEYDSIAEGLKALSLIHI